MWTAERIRGLGAVTDLPTAATIFGLSRTVAYDLAKRNGFPVPVIRAGSRYRVPVAAILTTLHIPTDPANDRREPADVGSDLTRRGTGGSITTMQSTDHRRRGRHGRGRL